MMSNKVSAEYVQETKDKQFISLEKLNEIDSELSQLVKSVMGAKPDSEGNVDITESVNEIIDGRSTHIDTVKGSETIIKYPEGFSTMYVKETDGYPYRGFVTTTRLGEEGYQILTLPSSNDTYIRKYSNSLSRWYSWVMITDDYGNVKSDAVDSDSSKTIATSKAVSIVNKKADEAGNKAVEALSKAEEAFLSGIDIKSKVIGAINSRGIGKPIPEDSSWDEVIAKAKEKGSSLDISYERCNQYKSDFNSWTGSNLSRYSVRAGIDSNTIMAIAVQDEKIITSMSDYIYVTVYLGRKVTPFNNAMVILMRIRGNSTSMSTELVKEGKGLDEGDIPIQSSFTLVSGNEWADKEFFNIFKVQE